MSVISNQQSSGVANKMSAMTIAKQYWASCVIAAFIGGAHLRPAVAKPLDHAQHSSAGLILTQSGVGPISKESSINKLALKKLFPSLSIKEDKGCDFECTDGFYKNFIVGRDATHLFTVAMQENTEKIAHIDIHDPSITTPEGFRVGSRFEDIQKKHPAVSCSNADPEDPVPYCYFKDLDHLRFTFTPSVDLSATKDYNRKMRNRKVALITWESR